jgi:hypothetical protein
VIDHVLPPKGEFSIAGSIFGTAGAARVLDLKVLALKVLALKALALKAFDQTRQCRAQDALLWYV